MWDRQITVYTPILHLCCACNTEFKTLSSLREHISLQSGEKPYRCHMCEEELADAAKLKCHIRMHTGREQDMCNEKPHKCDKCSKKFAQALLLKLHFKRMHTITKKKYKCSDCSFATSTNQNLKLHHDAIHLGLRPYKCSICCKDFTQQTHLRTHMKTHQPLTKNWSLQLLHKAIIITEINCHLLEKIFFFCSKLKLHTIRSLNLIL